IGNASYGTKVKLYDGWYEHDINSPVYFCYANNKMYKIDDRSFEGIDSASFPGGPILFTKHRQMIISPDGNLHYYLSNSNVLKFDPVTLRVVASTPYSNLGNLDFYNQGTTVANNNFIYFSGSDRGAFPCVIDMNTNTRIFTSNNRKDQGHLSPEGTFLVIG